MTRKLSVKISFILIVVMIIIMSLFTVYFVKARTINMEAELLEKGRIEALTGARVMAHIIEQAVANGNFTIAEMFDENYVAIPGTDPQKFHTRYDKYLDSAIRDIEDEFLKDEQVVFAVLVDRNGYLPTHNSKYSLPLTGDREKDKVGNRTKRLFNDPVGLAAAKNREPLLKQVYNRDTGERMWDISAPVYVHGKHWGGFRIGYSMVKTEKKIAALRFQIIIAMMIMLLVASVTIYIVLNRMVRPLLALTRAARRISEGELEEEVLIQSNDEIGTLAEAFNTMTTVIVKNLKEEIEKSSRLIDSIREAIGQLSVSSSHLQDISAKQSAGATAQSLTVEEVSEAAQNIATTAKQIMDTALDVQIIADNNNESCTNGTVHVSNAIDGMGRLKGQVQGIAESMLCLGENSQKIGGIIEIIDEISDQTNLLALNAAIEAAGAGEAGKRFAIVAKEFKRLAARTVEATMQIRELIEEIQKSTNSTIMVTEEGIKGVDNASSLVDKVQMAFFTIISMVEETSRAAKEIAQATQNQTASCEMMASAMNQVKDVAKEVEMNAMVTECSIAEIMASADKLKNQIEQES
ncbi:putative methyl-accepting chemotaxis protein [Geobacter sp. OR-1]|uniref:methyl-accepting chemotaxis protein n=1 Tax=Geobacter sp. OR-1 TaxID=1266765 RepID=UPI000541F780|nr:methyl-accepting chemotaxis protein [Geobacter sp. OR-1]GAM09191.1 putative methyl-accepting chemotaxis protein [Geobacter sp. OR-1]